LASSIGVAKSNIDIADLLFGNQSYKIKYLDKTEI